jgi:hypothetical protein
VVVVRIPSSTGRGGAVRRTDPGPRPAQGHPQGLRGCGPEAWWAKAGTGGLQGRNRCEARPPGPTTTVVSTSHPLPRSPAPSSRPPPDRHDDAALHRGEDEPRGERSGHPTARYAADRPRGDRMGISQTGPPCWQ